MCWSACHRCRQTSQPPKPRRDRLGRSANGVSQRPGSTVQPVSHQKWRDQRAAHVASRSRAPRSPDPRARLPAAEAPTGVCAPRQACAHADGRLPVVLRMRELQDSASPATTACSAPTAHTSARRSRAARRRAAHVPLSTPRSRLNIRRVSDGCPVLRPVVVRRGSFSGASLLRRVGLSCCASSLGPSVPVSTLSGFHPSRNTARPAAPAG